MNNNPKINLKSILSKREMQLVIAFFFFILALLIFTFYSPNYYDSDKPVQIDIRQGETFNEVVDSLYAKKVIGSKTNFKIIAFIYGAEKKIRAGRYTIPNGLSYIELIELLIEGSPVSEVRVTIPEGIWQTDLAALLKENLGLDSAKAMELSKSSSFLNSVGLETDYLEGYLLPETYYFYSSSTEEEILRRLKREMDQFFEDPKIQKQMAELGWNKHQVLTLASIIDGESNLVSEFKTISGVYHNRLRRGMALQADPTVQYLLRERRKNKIYYKDLEIDSKYNTYKYTGLPPGPINNPGKEAILAALFPEKTNYLYFVANGEGGHYFSTNYNDHATNVSRYRQWRRSQN